jgi:hypothetical protein
VSFEAFKAAMLQVEVFCVAIPESCDIVVVFICMKFLHSYSSQ